MLKVSEKLKKLKDLVKSSFVNAKDNIKAVGEARRSNKEAKDTNDIVHWDRLNKKAYLDHDYDSGEDKAQYQDLAVKARGRLLEKVRGQGFQDGGEKPYGVNGCEERAYRGKLEMEHKRRQGTEKNRPRAPRTMYP